MPSSAVNDLRVALERRYYFSAFEVLGLVVVFTKELLGLCSMDIYRFFHPHHNPRLHNVALRQQELSELEQAAAELIKALERAQQRVVRKPTPPLLPDHFVDLSKAMRFVSASLQTLCEAHPGDSREDVMKLIQERSNFAGWENWTTLVREQLALAPEEVRQPEPRAPERGESERREFERNGIE